MTIDTTDVQGLLTAFAAVVAALVSFWNAIQVFWVKMKVNEVDGELKAIRKSLRAG